MTARTSILMALCFGLTFASSDRILRAQTDVPPVGTLFLQARNGCTETLSRAGIELGRFTVGAGSLLSARDERQASPRVGRGRFEFHGDVELRVLPAGAKPLPERMPAHILMSSAPLVFNAKGVDLVIDNAGAAAHP